MRIFEHNKKPNEMTTSRITKGSRVQFTVSEQQSSGCYHHTTHKGIVNDTDGIVANVVCDFDGKTRSEFIYSIKNL